MRSRSTDSHRVRKIRVREIDLDLRHRPTLAQKILSGIEASDLRGDCEQRHAEVVVDPGSRQEDFRAHLLELRDKLIFPAAERAEAAAPSRLSVDDDVHSALVNLGYRPRDAEGAIESARKQLGSDAEFSALLKATLRQLTKS